MIFSQETSFAITYIRDDGYDDDSVHYNSLYFVV